MIEDGTSGASKRTFMRRAQGIGLLISMGLAALAACERGRPTGPEPTSSAGAKASAAAGAADLAGPPTVRLYLVSDLAGALEPCGCTKDQLGGVDHLAAWLRAEAPKAKASALVSAGPLFFMDPQLKKERATQDVAKAETLAESLKSMGFVAFSPGKNDFGAGAGELARLTEKSGGALLYSSATGDASRADGGPGLGRSFTVRELGGVKVAFIGASGTEGAPAVDLVRQGVVAAKGEGARVFIALASVGRGEAKRLADLVPELTAVVVGSPGGEGDLNTPAPPPEQVGSVLIAETGNHLTTVGVLDLHVREANEGGAGSSEPLRFADATGLALGRAREDLTRRIDERRARIAVWEKDPKIADADLTARRAEVTKLEAELRALDAPHPPPEGSFFRYTSQEVRVSLGQDPDVARAMRGYYKQINEHNRLEFAAKPTPPAAPGEPSYVGIAACSGCHAAPREVWDKTAHAHAYATLADQDKQFNLDCVGCHVTGYEKAGGSNVTHVKGLESVQCEVCHGPGSRHAQTPAVAMPVPSPSGQVCLTCHHPPHVEGFDPSAKMEAVLGKGHGR